MQLALLAFFDHIVVLFYHLGGFNPARSSTTVKKLYKLAGTTIYQSSRARGVVLFFPGNFTQVLPCFRGLV